MAYSRYISTKKGKKYGPYMYKSVRDGDTVKSIYIGPATGHKRIYHSARKQGVPVKGGGREPAPKGIWTKIDRNSPQFKEYSNYSANELRENNMIKTPEGDILVAMFKDKDTPRDRRTSQALKKTREKELAQGSRASGRKRGAQTQTPPRKILTHDESVDLGRAEREKVHRQEMRDFQPPVSFEKKLQTAEEDVERLSRKLLRNPNDEETPKKLAVAEAKYSKLLDEDIARTPREGTTLLRTPFLFGKHVKGTVLDGKESGLSKSQRDKFTKLNYNMWKESSTYDLNNLSKEDQKEYKELFQKLSEKAKEYVQDTHNKALLAEDLRKIDISRKKHIEERKIKKQEEEEKESKTHVDRLRELEKGTKRLKTGEMKTLNSDDQRIVTELDAEINAIKSTLEKPFKPLSKTERKTAEGRIRELESLQEKIMEAPLPDPKKQWDPHDIKTGEDSLGNPRYKGKFVEADTQDAKDREDMLKQRLNKWNAYEVEKTRLQQQIEYNPGPKLDKEKTKKRIEDLNKKRTNIVKKIGRRTQELENIAKSDAKRIESKQKNIPPQPTQQTGGPQYIGEDTKIQGEVPEHLTGIRGRGEGVAAKAEIRKAKKSLEQSTKTLTDLRRGIRNIESPDYLKHVKANSGIYKEDKYSPTGFVVTKKTEEADDTFFKNKEKKLPVIISTIKKDIKNLKNIDSREEEKSKKNIWKSQVDTPVDESYKPKTSDKGPIPTSYSGVSLDYKPIGVRVRRPRKAHRLDSLNTNLTPQKGWEEVSDPNTSITHPTPYEVKVRSKPGKADKNKKEITTEYELHGPEYPRYTPRKVPLGYNLTGTEVIFGSHDELSALTGRSKKTTKKQEYTQPKTTPQSSKSGATISYSRKISPDEMQNIPNYFHSTRPGASPPDKLWFKPRGRDMQNFYSGTKSTSTGDLMDSYERGELTKKDLQEARELGVINDWTYNRMKRGTQKKPDIK